jgi:5-methylcytosine-specific restriction endonuclease McrA
MQRYRLENVEKIKTLNANYFASNKQKLSIASKNWRSNNSERKAATDRLWVLENREKVRANANRWAEKNPDKKSLSRQIRRARLQQSKIFLVTNLQLKKLMTRPCMYCGGQAQHIDHVIALSRGGSHSIGNLVPSCAACNLSKGSKTIMEWKIYKAKLIQAELKS